MSGYEAVVLGASLGGVEALQVIVGTMTHRLPMPMLITQHMSPHGSVLDQVLGRAGPLPVLWGADGGQAEPGGIYLCPPSTVMTLEPGLTMRLHEKVASSRTVDELFGSAATAAGPSLLAVILTGMGSDGTQGARAVKACGGTVIAQDRLTSVAFGMPGSVIAAELADRVLPLPEIAGLLATLGA